MAVLTDPFMLSNGHQIPKVGFGTWQIPDGDAAYQAVSNALSVGYRHIDTARNYQNEASVGRAIHDAKVDRKDLFVTSKLPADIKTYDGVMASFEETFTALDVDYLDLYLIHAPWPWSKIGQSDDEGNIEAWYAMEALYQSGRVKAIGVSNFNVHDLENLFTKATVKPMVDQIQYYVGFTEPKITTFAKDNDLLVEAYSPLATGDLLKNEMAITMAQKYGVSVAQLALRFCIQNEVLPLPKATSLAHIEANTELDFEIQPADMLTLNQFADPAPQHFHNETQG
ncbi:aldo/keto reductase [Furfurilactobacillus curtus]|uniref:2,5-diketo-D-gluconic acid reductase n=1 Tax=Furfurilactobacillus curtus TaxID=1746200 RepID=A0ABQ5JM04_9LACO